MMLMGDSGSFITLLMGWRVPRLWLVKSDQMTWLLASDWSRLLHNPPGSKEWWWWHLDDDDSQVLLVYKITTIFRYYSQKIFSWRLWYFLDLIQFLFSNPFPGCRSSYSKFISIDKDLYYDIELDFDSDLELDNMRNHSRDHNFST